MIVCSMVQDVANNVIILSPAIPFLNGSSLFFRVDSLGLTFALLSSFLWIVTTLYSIAYMNELNEKNQPRYYAAFALSLSATLGIAFAGDLITFLIFFEILAIATYPLVIHKQTPEAILAGRKYLTYFLTSGTALLISILWIWQTTGNTSFEAGGFLAANFPKPYLGILFFLMVYGVAVKAALFPLHAWLPSAMVAPT